MLWRYGELAIVGCELTRFPCELTPKRLPNRSRAFRDKEASACQMALQTSLAGLQVHQPDMVGAEAHKSLSRIDHLGAE